MTTQTRAGRKRKRIRGPAIIDLVERAFGSLTPRECRRAIEAARSDSGYLIAKEILKQMFGQSLDTLNAEERELGERLIQRYTKELFQLAVLRAAKKKQKRQRRTQ